MDSVMDDQRTSIYNHRNWLLESTEYDEHVEEIFEDVVERIVESSWDKNEEKVDKEYIKKKLQEYTINKEFNSEKMEEAKEELMKLFVEKYKSKKEEFGEGFKKISKFVMLRIIDDKWRAHLEAIEALKESVGLRAYGQKDPVIEFKREAFHLFNALVDSVYDEITNFLMRITKVDPNKEEQEAKRSTAKLNFLHGELSEQNRKQDKNKNVNKPKKRFKIKK